MIDSYLLELLGNCRTFSFRFYSECPVGCAHCCISATNKQTKCNNLDTLEVLSALTYFKQISKIETCLMTGAELYIDEPNFLKLSNEIVLTLGTPVGILTSGYWGFSDSSYRSGIKYLRKAAVSFLQISLDKFHFKHKDPSKLMILIERLINDGVKVIVHETIEPGTSPMWRDLKKSPLVSTSVQYDFQEIACIGRASKLFNTFTNNVNSIPTDGCDFGSHIYVENNGYIYLCSGAGCNSIKRSIGKLSLNQPIIYFQRLKFLRDYLYYKQGPAKLIKQFPDPNIKWGVSNNPCSSCYTFFEGSNKLELSAKA